MIGFWIRDARSSAFASWILESKIKPIVVGGNCGLLPNGFVAMERRDYSLVQSVVPKCELARR
jgi:hypothetical protein